MSGGRTPGHGAVDIGDVAVGRCVRVYSSLWARSSWRYDAAAAAASLANNNGFRFFIAPGRAFDDASARLSEIAPINHRWRCGR